MAICTLNGAEKCTLSRNTFSVLTYSLNRNEALNVKTFLSLKGNVLGIVVDNFVECLVGLFKKKLLFFQI